jgi:hypothetical protein
MKRIRKSTSWSHYWEKEHGSSYREGVEASRIGARLQRKGWRRLSALVLDAGAFVAVDHGDRSMIARLQVARKHGIELRTSDPIDATVVLVASHGDRILTSDPSDLKRLATSARKRVAIIAC